jgi:SAM-dependent methyltransferase
MSPHELAAMPETSYGLARRLAFIAAAIQSGGAHSVLDLGCGTGAYVLGPLARRFPGVKFTGVDSDASSIAAARQAIALPNVALHLAAEFQTEARYDLVIASEVIEHVESPATFLVDIAARLRPEGRLLLTLPNGYGAAEWASFTEAVLRLTGVFGLLQRAKRLLVPAAAGATARDSLAVSPHINFFSLGALRRLLADTGWRIVAFQPRGLLCGFGWDLVIRGERLTAWNQRAADRVPPALVADWMFLLEHTGAPIPAALPYQRSGFSRLRRRMNEKVAARG